MKKIFTLACAILGLTAFASANQAKVLAPESNNVESASLKQSVKAAYTPAEAATQSRADEEGEWVKVSTGIWFEGPFAARFSDVDEGQWDVDIYQNEAKPGWIRLNPYYEGTQLATLLGKANEAPLDICIADPEKVYFPDWVPFGSSSFTYGSYCPENDWSQGTGYGNLTNGVITFPAGSVVYYNSGWKLLAAELKIVLDKTQYVDYTVNCEMPFCCPSAQQYLKLTKSDAISTVKIMGLDGHYPMNDGNASVIASHGTDVTAYVDNKVNFGFSGPNKEYSILYVGLDADGNIKAQGAAYIFITDDDADNWKALGDATYTEGIVSEFFTDIDSQDLTCVIEENVNTPGYYRLVNPYADYAFGSKDPHNHYIYINATDPEHVYVEPSSIGVYINSKFGDAAAGSWGAWFLDDVASGESNGVWGKMADGVITVPAFRFMLSKYNDCQWMSIFSSSEPSPFKVVLPAQVPSSLALVSVVGGEPVVFPLEFVDDGIFNGEIEIDGPLFYFAEMNSDVNEAPAMYAVAGGKNYWGAEEPEKEIGEGGELTLVKADEPNAFKLNAENFPAKAKFAIDFGKGTVAVTSVSSGVETISTDSEAPVEYFNLQGIRIDNPAEGQIVIRRQGSSAVKTIVR